MKNSLKNSGFTLIETLVAITILIIGVLGPLALAVGGITDGLYAKNQITANFLAQEALEAVVNQRDSNLQLVSASGSFDNLPSGSLKLDDPETGVVSPGGPVDIQFDATDHRFVSADTITALGHEVGSPRFTRTIDIKPDTGTGNLYRKVSVTVSWQNTQFTGTSFTLVSYLYDLK